MMSHKMYDDTFSRLKSMIYNTVKIAIAFTALCLYSMQIMVNMK